MLTAYKTTNKISILKELTAYNLQLTALKKTNQ